MDKDEAITLCNEILDMIDSEVPDFAWDRAASFFESVRDKVSSMLETIETMDDPTIRQTNALENMREGVAKWLDD